MTDNAKTLFDPKKEFICSNCGRLITRGHFIPSSGGSGDWVCEELAGEEIVDISLECSKLIDENLHYLLL